MSTGQPGWLPDPTGRHEHRYWDGSGWTDHVADRGVASVDPIAPQPPPQPTTGSGQPWASGPPPGQPGPGYPSPWAAGPSPGYGYQPPPGRGNGPLLVVLGLVVVAAAVGGAFYLTSSSDDEDDPRRQEYVDAIAASLGEDADGIVQLSEAENECLADAQVDIIGLDTLEEHVTPAEIRDDPDASLVDFGIQPTHDQGLEMVDALGRCADDIGAALAAAIDSNEIPVDDVEAVGACLAEDFDSGEVRDLLASSFVAGEDADMTEDQATAAVDWLGGCVDFRAIAMAEFEQQFDADTVACVDAGLTDEWFHDSLVAEFTGDEDASDDLDQEMQDAIADCFGGG